VFDPDQIALKTLKIYRAALRQPADCASASEQNQRSPLRSDIWVLA
jgi:hypothetical protein